MVSGDSVVVLGQHGRGREGGVTGGRPPPSWVGERVGGSLAHGQVKSTVAPGGGKVGKAGEVYTLTREGQGMKRWQGKVR